MFFSVISIYSSFVWSVKFEKGLVILQAVQQNLNFTGNTKNRIFLSPCGNMMLLMMGFEKLFLWQKIEQDDSGNHFWRMKYLLIRTAGKIVDSRGLFCINVHLIS
jgi:hypothetical protein